MLETCRYPQVSPPHPATLLAKPTKGFLYCCCCIASVMSDSVRPHRQMPTRLPSPWDSPGKNTGVGCHFLLQCRKVKSESEVVQSCLTLSRPMDCSLPDSSIHGISRQEYWSGVPLPSPKSFRNTCNLGKKHDFIPLSRLILLNFFTSQF